jgi:hypothetical protein
MKTKIITLTLIVLLLLLGSCSEKSSEEKEEAQVKPQPESQVEIETEIEETESEIILNEIPISGYWVHEFADSVLRVTKSMIKTNLSVKKAEKDSLVFGGYNRFWKVHDDRFWFAGNFWEGYLIPFNDFKCIDLSDTNI